MCIYLYQYRPCLSFMAQFWKAKGLRKTKPIPHINSNHHHSSCSMFVSDLFIIICGCEKVSSVEEALLTQALPQPCSHAGGSATRRWALIEPADLTFVSLTLRGASAPCLDHNTISNSEPLTSSAQRSRREAKRHQRWAESRFAFQLQLHDFCFPSHCQTTQQETRHKSVFCS